MNHVKIPIYKLPNLKQGRFQSRPNRFVAEIKYKGEVQLAHVHDPGRLKELLVKNADILFAPSNGKLKYYIKAVKTDDEWILIDTSLHSKLALQVFKLLPEFNNIKEIKSEVAIGKSRIDFTLDGVPLEVKGVSLVNNGLALFPDAPTLRGTRHVKEIMENEGILLFLVVRSAQKFAPNEEIDPQFASKLSEAREKGIKIFAVQLSFDGEIIYFNGKIKLADF